MNFGLGTLGFRRPSPCPGILPGGGRGDSLAQLLVALGVALLDGAALGLIDLARVLQKFRGMGDPSEIPALLAYAWTLSIPVALAVTLPVALVLRTGPARLRRADPWKIQHGAWVGANVLLLIVWKRYAAVTEAGGHYGFSLRDVLFALVLAVLAGMLLGPSLDHFWRLVGGVLPRLLGRVNARRAGAGIAGALCLAGLAAYIRDTGAQAVQAPAAERKNIVLVIGDAMRPDHLSLYGYKAPTTPNLDRIASHAVIATRYLNQSSYTIPSFASIITSRNPASHGVTGYGNVLAEGFTTLAEALHGAGYETAAYSATQLIGRAFGFAQGFETYRILRDFRGDFFYGRILDGTGLLRREKRADAAYMNQRVLCWLARPHPRPFFLLVFYADPHFEYDPPPRFVARFADPDYLRVTSIPDFLAAYGQGKKREEDDLDFARALYDAEIAYVDEATGALWSRVEAMGIADRTVMAVTSDHGEQFFEHGSSRHGKSLYVEEVHSPLVIVDRSLPGRALVEAPTRAIDLYPTLLEAAGVPPPKGMEGISILPLAGKGPRAPVRESVLMVQKDNYLQAYWVDPWMLIFDRDKIVTPAQRGLELYNLADDPGEKRDLSSARPEVLARMVNELDARLRQDRSRGPAPEKPIDAERMQLLRELHYVK